MILSLVIFYHDNLNHHNDLRSFSIVKSLTYFE